MRVRWIQYYINDVCSHLIIWQCGSKSLFSIFPMKPKCFCKTLTWTQLNASMPAAAGRKKFSQSWMTFHHKEKSKGFWAPLTAIGQSWGECHVLVASHRKWKASNGSFVSTESLVLMPTCSAGRQQTVLASGIFFLAHMWKRCLNVWNVLDCVIVTSPAVVTCYG